MPSLADLTSGAQAQLTDLFELFGSAPTAEQASRARVRASSNMEDPRLQAAMGFSPLGIAGALKGAAGSLTGKVTPEELARIYERFKAIRGAEPAGTPAKPLTAEEIERLFEAWKNPFKTKAD